MRRFKIILSALFVLAVAFVVVRGCAPAKKPRRPARPVTMPKQKKAGHPAFVIKKVRTAAGPRMAIILDDWGNNASLLKLAYEIGRPVTLSVMPHLPRSTRIAEEAHLHGMGVMVHLPMEPETVREPLEPRTILRATKDADIVRTVDEALLSVPYAEGVNNHEGSAATNDSRVMRTLLGRLKQKKLFFIDSKVTASPVAEGVARETGIPFAARDVFIDNRLILDAVKSELRRAVRIARASGEAVVIGHDHKTTLTAIREMVPEIEEAGVRLVSAKEIAENR